MTDPLVQVVSNTVLGEGPHWNAAKQELLYVDIYGSPSAQVHRFVPSTGEHVRVNIPEGPVGLVIPVQGEPDQYVIGVGRDISIMEWDGKSSTPTKITKLYSVEPTLPENRFNDGKCDSLGRLWAGTIAGGSQPTASLYKFVGNEAIVMQSNIGTSNGIAWNSANTIMYYNDTATRRVDRFDYNHTEGTISNRRPVYDFNVAGEAGSPDGMTIDSNGNLWVGCWGGNQIIQVDPNTGRKIKSIPFPTSNVTSAAFGGPNLDILYVTTASSGLSEIDLAKQPAAGAIYQITNTGAQGQSAGNNFVVPTNSAKGPGAGYPYTSVNSK